VEFLVEFDVNVPPGTSEPEVNERVSAEALAAAKLAEAGHLVRLWKPPEGDGGGKAVGLYRAENSAQLDGLLRGLPLYEWAQIVTTPLAPHPNDPVSGRASGSGTAESEGNPQLVDPRLSLVFHLEASLAEPLELGQTEQGHRRIVPLTGGTFTGPELRGTLVPGTSADWQTILHDGTALGDIRYTLRTDAGDLLYVQSRSVRHGSAEVLARLGRGEDVDPSEYTFRTNTQIVTGAPQLDWLNKGVFVGVAGRQAAGVIYEIYLVA
jgi:muconolactone delta-isomerase